MIYGKQFFLEMNLEKIHRAGAKNCKGNEEGYRKGNWCTLGNDNIIPQVSENLQAKLVQSIRSVFAGSDQKTFHDDTFASKDIPDLMEEPVMEENLEEYGEVKQLEPEHLNPDKIKQLLTRLFQQNPQYLFSLNSLQWRFLILM